MKKNLFVCALFALVMAFTADAYAQKATGDDYKNLKKQEKLMDKELQKKAIKSARKEAKALEKEGFKTPVGKLPLAKQIENAWEKQAELDMEGKAVAYNRLNGAFYKHEFASDKQIDETLTSRWDWVHEEFGRQVRIEIKRALKAKK